MKNGPIAAVWQICDLATGPKSQIRSKMSAVSSKSALWAESETSDPAQNAKVVYPPPSQGQIQGIKKWAAEMTPAKPTFARAVRSTKPKIGLILTPQNQGDGDSRRDFSL